MDTRLANRLTHCKVLCGPHEVTLRRADKGELLPLVCFFLISNGFCLQIPHLLPPLSIVLPTYHIRPDGENARFSETKARLIAKESLESELKGKGAEKWENHNFEVRSP